MSENSFEIKLRAVLDKVKSIANIKSDIKAIEPKLPKIKIQGTLDKTVTQKELNTKIKSIKPKVKVDADTTQVEKKIKKIGKQENKTTITPTVDNTQVVSGLKQAQKETKTLWERFTANIFGSNLIRMGTQKVIQAVHEALRSIKELDTIKTNIQMVSGTSDSAVNDMMSSYNAMAKNLSSTTKDVAEAANEFLRMGESIQNTNELIRSSQILSKVGMIDSADAASYLISSLKGYQVAAEDSLDIVSKLTSVDLEAAVSAGGLAEAISRCSNIANNSGTSMDRLIGYTAAVGEVTQESMSVIGNAFKSIYSRMNNIKVGRFIDEETGESLSDTEAVLNKLGIQLRDTADTYRDFDDVLNDIGTRWKDFTQVEQNAISVAVAGTMQRNRFLVLMDNWTKALEYSEVATNSAGNALERYGVYQDSIEAKTNELTAAMESLSTNTISEELYSGIIEATTGLVEFLDKMNLLKASFAGLVAMGVSKAIVAISAGFITAAKSTAQLSAAMALFDNGKSIANLKKIGHACKGLSDRQLKLILSTKGLRHEERLWILAGKGVAEAEREQTLTTLGFAAAEDKAVFSTISLRVAFKSLWATITANPIGLIVTAVSVAAMVFTGFNRAMEEARKKAKELGDSFKSAKSEIEDYKSQIEELHKTINDSNSSIEDVTSARKTLMSVQNELIDKFGTEETAIKNVNKAIEGQADALATLTQTLAQTKWQEIKNDFNDAGFWNGIANSLQGKNNIERMLDEYGEKAIRLDWENYAEIDTLTDEMVAKLENIGIDIKVNTEDLQGIRDFDPLTESISDTTGAYMTITGNAEEVYSKLLALQKIAGDNSLDRLYDRIESTANSYKELTETYKDFYDQYILYEKILTEDSDYADKFKDITDAYEEYQEAFTSGDEDRIKESTEKYAEILTEATAKAIANSDSDVATYFEGMYPTLRSTVEGWKFNVAFDANTDNLQDKVQSVLDELKDADGRSLTAEEILGLGEANEQYQNLISIAHSYNMSIEEMIELLKERNMVSAMDYQSLVGLFGQENVDKLSPEDIEIAYQIKNVSNMSFDELQAEIEKTREIAEEPIAVSSISDTVSQLNTQLKPTFDSLKSAYNDIFTSDGFALDNIDILSTCDSIKSKLDDIAELGLSVDYSSYEDFVRVLSDSESESDDVKGAFDSLATSITQAALSGTEDFATMKAALEDLGVVNNEIVAFDALAGNAEMLEEALTQANVSMDDFIVSTEDGSVAATEAGRAFLEEKVGAENCAVALNILAFHKQLCNEQGMNTAGEVANLKTLAENAGYTGEVIQYLTELEQIYQEVASGTIDPGVIGAKIVRAAQLQTLIQGAAAKIDYKPIEKSAAKAGSSAGKSYADALKDELSDLNSVINYIGDTIDDQIDLFEDQKDAAVEALEQEMRAAEEALEAEKELVQEKIDAKQAEIDAIEEAAKARKNELDLQKAQYDLERMQNQKTMLVYSEEKGMHYRTDDSKIADAKEAVTEAKENIQIAGMEKEISGLNDIIDDLDKKITESNEYYDKLIEETEKYWDGLIKGLEEYKSRWKELADIEEQAKMGVYLQNLGITTEDVLNMSESAFESFKGTYLGLLGEMYAGNDEMIGMLQRFGGISTDALRPLSGTINTVAESLDNFAVSTGNAGTSTSAASESMGNLSTNTSELNSNLSGVSDTLDNILEDNKLETIAEQMGDIAESVQSVSDALNDMPDDIDLSKPIEQFDALGNAVDKASSSLSGGNVSKADTPDGTSGKNTPNVQGNSGSNGSGGLVGAIKEVKSETDKSIGTGEDSGAVGQFHQLGESVMDVTAAVGGGSESGKGNGGEGSENLISSIETLGETTTETLGEPDGDGAIGKFGEMGNTIAEAENHVQGIIDKMNELDGMTAECSIVVNVETRGSVPAYAEGTAISDAVGSMGSGEYHPKYEGGAHVEGTANVTGNWGVSDPGRSLVGELGQELWVHAKDGTFETVGDNGAEFINTEKNDIIFNHLQTQELLNRGSLAGRGAICNGKAYINGTNGVVVTQDGNVLIPYNPDTDTSGFAKLYKAWNKHFGNMDDNVEKIQKTLTQHVTMEYNQKMQNEVNNFVSRSSSVVNNNNRNIQQPVVNHISVTLPNVTNSTSAESLMMDLQSLNRKKFQFDWNK